MRLVPTVRTLALATLIAFSAACGESSPTMADCPAPESQPENAVVVPLHLKTMAGEETFALNKQLTTEAGIPWKASKFRYYLSDPKLIDASGRAVSARFATHDGGKLPYDVALVDAGKPGSDALALVATPGQYVAVDFMLGVPDACPTGEELNHGDASARVAPLDVDSDMYWNWDPGYIHLKIEGKAQVGGEWESFFFHVGEDGRRPRLRLAMPLEIAPEAHNHLALTIDVNRLFVSDAGAHVPDLTRDRKAHGGALTDQMAANIARSGFLRAQ